MAPKRVPKKRKACVGSKHSSKELHVPSRAFASCNQRGCHAVTLVVEVEHDGQEAFILLAMSLKTEFLKTRKAHLAPDICNDMCSLKGPQNIMFFIILVLVVFVGGDR